MFREGLASPKPVLASDPERDPEAAFKAFCELCTSGSQDFVHLKKIKAYLRVHPAFVNQKTTKGQTGLFLAALAGKAEIIKELYVHGAYVNSRDFDGVAALHVATTNGHLNAVRMLLAAGADAALKFFDSRLATEVSALDLAKDQNKPTILLALTQGPDDQLRKELKEARDKYEHDLRLYERRAGKTDVTDLSIGLDHSSLAPRPELQPADLGSIWPRTATTKRRVDEFTQLLLSDVKAMEIEQSRAESESAATRKQMSAIQTELAATQAANADLDRHNDELAAQLDAATRRAADLESLLQSARSDAASVAERLQRSKTRKAQVKIELAETRVQNAGLEEELAAYKQRASELQTLASDLESQLDAVTGENGLLRAECERRANVDAERQRVEEELLAAGDVIEQLRADLQRELEFRADITKRFMTMGFPGATTSSADQ